VNSGANPDAAVKLLPCDHKGHGFKFCKPPLAEMQGKVAYIRPKVVGSIPGPYVSGNYVHHAALFLRATFLVNSAHTTYIVLAVANFTLQAIMCRHLMSFCANDIQL
jgi:hypothetical protein